MDYVVRVLVTLAVGGVCATCAEAADLGPLHHRRHHHFIRSAPVPPPGYAYGGYGNGPGPGWVDGPGYTPGIGYIPPGAPPTIFDLGY